MVARVAVAAATPARRVGGRLHVARRARVRAVPRALAAVALRPFRSGTVALQVPVRAAARALDARVSSHYIIISAEGPLGDAHGRPD